MSGGRLPKQQGREVDTARPQVTQRGDRVEVTSGRYAGQTGQVIGVRLVRDGGIRRVAAVLLDAVAGDGVRLRHFTEGLLRVLD